MLQLDILTLFPKIINSYTEESILKRAQEKNLVKIAAHNIRNFSLEKHQKVDNRPYGGGAGMVLMALPILRAVDQIKKTAKPKIIILSAKGKQFDQKMAQDLSRRYKHIILISGRYEGIDERVKKILQAEEISIGPFVMTDGDIGALAITSAVVRLLPGVLGNEESLTEESFSKATIKNHKAIRLYGSTALTEYPHYTRPEILKYKGKNYAVPKILLTGDHKKIQEWRTGKALGLTK
ncbi:MAG TPA: tRNA (guanosine(37)-N1)-methyltransferase TrmD [Patescibacteria group bacterium]|nr:tRNA (guanosine(37)-N1)-methyltransferase TrmD [Patescibacteria group bacterium]